MLIGLSSQGSPFWNHSTTCSFQFWNTSSQAISKTGTQPYLSADRLPKVILRLQPSSTHSLTQPCPLEGQDPTPPTTRQHSLPPGSLHKPLNGPHPLGDIHQTQEELQFCSLWKGDHKYSKLDKTSQQRICLCCRQRNKIKTYRNN